MANSFKSEGSGEPETNSGERAGWIKVGLVAAATAFAGGLVAAWWYRQTITKLRQAENDGQSPHFGIPDEDAADGE
jgi:hypothetical protein